MNDEMLRQSLIEIMDKGLLNNFVNEVFGYSFKGNEYVYIQYKIVNSNIIINIYDNTKDNRFKAFIFTRDHIGNEENIYYINIEDCYNDYKNGIYDKKLYLIGALLLEKKIANRKKIINLLFNNEIRDIFLKHFTV